MALIRKTLPIYRNDYFTGICSGGSASTTYLAGLYGGDAYSFP
jgi:hypothetical protein